MSRTNIKGACLSCVPLQALCEKEDRIISTKANYASAQTGGKSSTQRLHAPHHVSLEISCTGFFHQGKGLLPVGGTALLVHTKMLIRRLQTYWHCPGNIQSTQQKGAQMNSK